MVGDYIRFVLNLEKMGFKKRGRRPIFNANQFYPIQLERLLQQITTKELTSAMEDYIAKALENENFGDDLNALENYEHAIPTEFKSQVTAVANQLSAKVASDFAIQSEMTIGKPYYPPATKDQILKAWEDNFQVLCKSAEGDTKKEISRIVAEAKMQGWNGRQLTKAIREKLPSDTKHRAELIARTELGKLNSAARLGTYKELGIEYYVWMTTLDGRERDSHRAMNGKICSVSDPNVWYEENEADPLHPIEHQRSGGMFIGNPGEDFQCRCSMISWDPYIDGKYEVKEAPDNTAEMEAERAAQEAEMARAEQEAAEQKKALEGAIQGQKEAERKTQILQAANDRHAERTEQQRNLIRAKWQNSHPHAIMPEKFDTAEKVFNFINRIEENKVILGQEKISQNGEFTFAGIASAGNNGSTRMRGDISLSRKKLNLVVSAFEKIRQRKQIEETEDMALCTLWHEMRHNSHKFLNFGIQGEIFNSRDKVKYMELLNEFVSRKTMIDFYKMAGVKELPFPSIQYKRADTAYDVFVQRFEKSINFFNIKTEAILPKIKSKLFDGVYNEQKETLVEIFKEGIGEEISSKEISSLLKNILYFNNWEPDLEKFEKDVLIKLKESIDKKKKNKKKKS